MSEENKITSIVKTKDPKKVAAGKRLAEWSKKSKQSKKEVEHESAHSSASEEASVNNVGLMVSIVGTLVGVAGLYYVYCPLQSKNQTDSEVDKTDHSIMHAPSHPTETSKPKISRKKLDLFD